MEKIKCSICGYLINENESHNAQPINNGRCCEVCNMTVVIPKRVERASKKENIYEVKEEK